MITKFNCIHCKNTDPKKAAHYDGAVGYEATYCTVCGCYVDHYGWHEKDESSERFIRKEDQPLKYVIFFFEDAGRAYAENGFDEFIKELEVMDYSYEICDTSVLGVGDLMVMVMEWGCYNFLTEEEFNKLSDI